MEASGVSGVLGAPLLGSRRAPRPLGPLYILTLIQAIAYCIVRLPALTLRFQELAEEAGFDEAATAAAYGRLTALRSVVEFLVTPTLAAWSDRVGRRRVLGVCITAFLCECALLAVTRHLLAFAAVYVLCAFLSDSNGALEKSCIADATTKAGRAIAFGRLFTVVGVALILGPAISGEMAARHGYHAPFVAGAILCGCGLSYMLLFVPEYLPPSRRAPSAGGTGGGGKPAQLLGDLAVLVSRSPQLAWYLGASCLANAGLGASGAVQAFWAREALGWDARDLGRFFSLMGVTMVVAQGALLPVLQRLARGREICLAQLCFLLNAAKISAFGLAPSTAWVYAALVLGAAGGCGATVLLSLLSGCANEQQQGLLSGGSAALGAAAQTAGALLGSQVLAFALRRGLGPGAAMHLSAACFAMAAACVARAGCAPPQAKPEGAQEMAKGV